MKNITLDFGITGWKDAVKEFGFSIVKTAIAAGALAVVAKIDAYQVPAGIQNAAELTIALALVRAILTSFWVYVTKTSASVVPIEQATETVDLPEEPAVG